MNEIPELEALSDTPQDPRWHPEGNALIHTQQTVTCMTWALLFMGCPLDTPMACKMLLSALLHDIAKPETTVVHPPLGDLAPAKITAYNHDKVGEDKSKKILERLSLRKYYITRVPGLVGLHMRPFLLSRDGVTQKAYTRLKKKLIQANTDGEDLLLLALADKLGRGAREPKEILTIMKWVMEFKNRLERA